MPPHSSSTACGSYARGSSSWWARWATGRDRPGTVRRRRVEHAASEPERASTDLAAAVGDPAGVDRTVAVLQHWGGLPPETVVIEVEPADSSVGLGFSDDVAACFDEVLTTVRQEIEACDDGAELPGASAVPAPERTLAADGMAGLVDYAERRRRAQAEDRNRGGLVLDQSPETSGVEIATRSRPWGMGLTGGGDWLDVTPMADGWMLAVIGEVPARGMDGVSLKADLRVATRAYADVCGPAPARIVGFLDALVERAGCGVGTTVAVVAVHPVTGEIRLCSAGHCPPLVIDSTGSWYLHDTFTSALGAGAPGGCDRPELTARLDAGATLLLFTDGLLERRNQPLALGLLHLQAATGDAVGDLESFCDDVLRVCVDRRRRGDDLSLLALRRS